MAREGRFKKDEDVTGLEAAIRSAAGLGVGYAAINNYRTIYDQVKRSFLGLPISANMKRSFTNLFQFSGMDFEKTALDVSLSTDKYMKLIPPDSMIQQSLDAIEKSNKDIRFRLQNVSGIIRDIQNKSIGAARQFGAESKTYTEAINNLVTTFDEFRNDYFEKAVSAAEQATEMSFAGRANTKLRERLRDLNFQNIRAIQDQLNVIRERLNQMTTAVSQTRTEIVGIWNRGLIRKAQHITERTTSGQMVGARDVAMEVLNITETHLKNTASTIRSLTDISLVKPGRTEFGTAMASAIQGTPIRSKMWAVKGGVEDLRRKNTLRKLVGIDAFKSLSAFVSEGFKDPFAPNEAIILGERSGTLRETKSKFFKYISETIRELDKTGQFDSLSIEESRGPNNQVIIRGVAKDPIKFGTPDLILRYDIPQTTLGVSHLKRGVKDFFVPFQRQKDALLEQARVLLARQPWDLYNAGTAQQLADQISHRTLINLTQFSSTTLSDFMTSGRIDTKLTHQESKIYQGGFDALQQVQRNKMARGGIIHIDTEFGESMFPTQVGWTLTDSKGKVISVKQYAIGPKAAALTPAHIRGRSIAGQPILREISENQLDQVIDALAADLNHPLLHGHPIQVAGKNFGMAEGVTLANLLKLAEEKNKGIDPAKFVQIRSAITQNVIDTNYFPGVTGNTIEIKGAHLFRLLRDHVGNYPEIKAVIEQKLQMLGIPSLDEAGLRVFEKGLHTAVQDSYIQALFADAIYMKNKFTNGGKNLPNFERALQRVKDGFLPDEFVPIPKHIADLMSSGGALPLLARNVSAASFLGGRQDITATNLAGPFAHLRRGADNRPFSTQQLRFFGTGAGSAERRIQRDIQQALTLGQKPDVGRIIKGALNDIRTKSIVLLDPMAGIAKDEFVLSERFFRRNFLFPSPERIEVDKVHKDLRVGDVLGQGKFIIGTKDRTGTLVDFKGIASGETGIVRAIEPGGEGERTVVVIDRMFRLTRQTPMLSGSGAVLPSILNLEDFAPHLGPKYSSLRLADYATGDFKANPGAALTDLYTFLFEHAGENRERQMYLRQIIARKFKGGKGGAFADGFPIERRLGLLSVGHRDFEWWKEFAQGYKDARGAEFGIGAYVEIAEEYNQRVNGAFTTTKIFFGNASPSDLKTRVMGNNIMVQYARFMSEPTMVEANIKIALQNLKRPTNPDLVTRIARRVRTYMDHGDIFRAMKNMRPDMAATALTTFEFMDKLPAMFGLLATKSQSGQNILSAASVSTEPFSFKDPNLLSRVGEILRGQDGARIGTNFMQALKNLRGSEKLFDVLSQAMTKDSILEIARMFPHQHATASRSNPFMRELSLKDASRFLGKWLARQETAQHIIPAEEVYRINGALMSRTSAVQHLGVSGMAFDEAIRKGLGEIVTDRNLLRSRMITSTDAFQMTNMGPFQLAFGRKLPVQLPGHTVEQTMIHHRMLVMASSSDYFPIEVKNLKTGTIETRLLESLSLGKMREIINTLNSGVIADGVSGDTQAGTLVQSYYNLQNNYILKANLQTHQMSMSVPTARLKAHPVFDLVNIDATTKFKARQILESVFGQKSVNKGMFLAGRGILPSEGLIAGTDEKLVQLLQTLTDNDLKDSARRILGNVKMLDRTGMSPSAFMVRHIAGEIAMEGGPLPGADALRPRMQTHLGVLRQIIAAKDGLTKEMTKGFQDAFMDGIVPIPMFGAKYPLTDPTKFVMGFFFRAGHRGEQLTRFSQKYGGEAGKIVVQPFATTIVGNIDVDGDILQFLLGRGQKTLDIINKNSMLPELDPIVQFTDDVADGITTFNVRTKQIEKYSLSTIVGALGIQGFKNDSINKQLIGKQLAGIATIYSENIRPYLERLLGGRGTRLANDIGQENINKMFSQAWEGGGALTEAILKGKATKSSGATAIADIFKNFDLVGFERFRDVILGGDPNDPLIRKLTMKIAGTEHLFPGTRGLSTLDLLGQVIQDGNGDIWAGMTPEEKVMSMSLRPSDLYGMRGGLWDAQMQSKLLQDLPTRFTVEGQEKLMTSIKRNIQNDVGERTWKLASKGMGWMAAAGALYLAFNIFRPDQTRFLGHMPGQGGEVHDYTFTRPEYNMQNLLNVPYINPYAKDKIYVQMDNPNTTFKLARMGSSREQKDFFKIHAALGTEGPRINSRDRFLGQRSDHKNLLERFGKV